LLKERKKRLKQWNAREMIKKRKRRTEMMEAEGHDMCPASQNFPPGTRRKVPKCHEKAVKSTVKKHS
jgi:hypothetical protein